ncbi:MAG TPA: hypothetical protein VH637_23725 [Streptosporangiaceae bacterium]
MLQLEPGAPPEWSGQLTALGHEVRTPGDVFGHAQFIDVRDGRVLAGAADPRAVTGSVAAA